MEGSYISNLLQSAPGRVVRPVLPPRKKSGCGRCCCFLFAQVNELLLFEICLRGAVWWRGESWVVCQESWKCATALLLTGGGKSQNIQFSSFSVLSFPLCQLRKGDMVAPYPKVSVRVEEDNGDNTRRAQ